VSPHSEDPDLAIAAYKHDIDRTLLRQSLARTIDERFLELMRLQVFAEELRRAGAEARRP